MAAVERENLYTKKAEKEFFKQAEEEAAAQGKLAVLLKGFDNNEKNMLIDERAYKIKQASREHTINDWQSKCVKLYINQDVAEEWARIGQAMKDLGRNKANSADESMALLESELKSVHDIMGKKWREANSKEASVRKAFAILFGLTMVFESDETWLLYAGSIKAAINKQFKVFGASWKKVLHNDLELLGLTKEQYETVQHKLGMFDAHINHIEGVDIKFGYK